MQGNGQPLLLEGAAPPPEGPNPFKIAWRCLRGRLVWAAVLAVLLAAPAAFVGYKALPPLYSSQGILVVQSELPKIVYDTEDNRPIARFDAYMQTQATLLGSRRVADRASLLLEQRLPSWPRGIDGVRALQDGLYVEPVRGGETIHVYFTSEDPEASRAAVNAVLDAYEEIFGEESEFRTNEVERKLRDTVRRLQTKQESLEQQLAQQTRETGFNDPQQLETKQQATAQQVIALGDDIHKLERHLSRLEAGVGTDPPPEDRPQLDPFRDVPLEVLAQKDPTLRGLLDQRDALRREIAQKGTRLGPEHREMRTLNARLDTIEDDIAARLERLGSMPQNGGAGSPVQTQQTSIENIRDPERARRLLADWKAEKADLDNEFAQMTTGLTALRGSKKELEDVTQQLDDAQTQLTKHETENVDRSQDRIRIAQRGDLPLSPSTDRRLALAAGGAMFGGGAGIGLVGLFGLWRYGYRYIDDLSELQPATPLLGVVPDLADAGSEEDANAALCVHHLRNLLQVKHGRSERARVYTVTSPAAGDGKTSLTMALGISFAAVGYRTLLIDADLVAGGLSRQLGLGHEPGLWQALLRGSVDGEIQETQHVGLWALPGGIMEGVEPERLSKEALGSILDELGEQFDTVLLDTGPLLGSLDASLAAANSDDVILTVSRGQRPRLVKAAIERLRTLRVSCAGIVFNRASWEDLRKSVSPVSLASSSLRSVPGGHDEKGKNRSGRKGAARRSLGGAMAGGGATGRA